MITAEVKSKVDALWTAIPTGGQSAFPAVNQPLTLLSKIASRGQTDRFRTSRHIIELMVAMIPSSRSDLRSGGLT